jgi:hypothetical protein
MYMDQALPEIGSYKLTLALAGGYKQPGLGFGRICDN